MIATKVFNAMGDDPNQRGLSRKHILHAIDDSLRRLGTDYVDLYQIHRFDYSHADRGDLRALDDLVRAGKVLYIGASSMFAWQFAKMLHVADAMGLTRFVTMQNHYNLIYREEEREMIPLCREEGIGVIPWSPLARGFLAGNRRKEAQAERCALRPTNTRTSCTIRIRISRWSSALSEISRKRGVSNAQVALAWVLAQPGITSPIVGARRMEHLDDAVAAVNLKLDESELRAIEEPYRPHPVLGHS